MGRVTGTLSEPVCVRDGLSDMGSDMAARRIVRGRVCVCVCVCVLDVETSVVLLLPSCVSLEQEPTATLKFSLN